jgi:nucleoside phosphorylase
VTTAVVFALNTEWAPWRSRHGFERVVPGPPAVYEAIVGRSCVRVALSGVGAPNPGHLIDVVSAAGVDAMVAAGLAGALRPPYRCDDIIVARHVRSASTGSSQTSDSRLVEVASRCGATVVDVLVCADRVAGGVEQKRRLAAHGDAVDMESFRILDEAGRRRIPSVAIRVIGDTAGEALPLDFNRAIRADGSVDVLNLVGQAVASPARWPALVSFGWRQRRAAGVLARYLDRFVDAVGASGD